MTNDPDTEQYLVCGLRRDHLDALSDGYQISFVHDEPLDAGQKVLLEVTEPMTRWDALKQSIAAFHRAVLGPGEPGGRIDND